MNARMRWLTAALVLGVFAVGVHLYSQEAKDTPKPQVPKTLKEETEESVLLEKANALEAQHTLLIEAHKAGAPFGSPTAVSLAGCNWQLALAELAAVRGQGPEQIQHLEQAVKFAEDAVEIERKLYEAGRATDVTESIVRRADAKLALIRAKKQQAGR